MRFTIQTLNMDNLAKRLAQNAEQAKKALTATGNDMKARIPGYVATEVTGVYNIKSKKLCQRKPEANQRKWQERYE